VGVHQLASCPSSACSARNNVSPPSSAVLAIRPIHVVPSHSALLHCSSRRARYTRYLLSLTARHDHRRAVIALIVIHVVACRGIAVALLSSRPSGVSHNGGFSMAALRICVVVGNGHLLARVLAAPLFVVTTLTARPVCSSHQRL
jgi:hypothetical protein